jgi:hypothetical protein
MRQFIDIVEKATLCEAGVSRMVQHIREGTPFFMLSAMRANVPYDENLRRSRRLRHILNGLPVSYITTEGEYHELGADEPSEEFSFFVMPGHQHGATSIDLLRRIGVKLMHDFDQDSIVFGDGETITLLEHDGNEFPIGDNATFNLDKIAKLPGFTKIRGRKFSFTDEPTQVTYGEPAQDVA